MAPARTRQLGRDLAAHAQHVVGRHVAVVHQHLDREPVDHGADLDPEVVGVPPLRELARLAAVPDDVRDRPPPAPVQDLVLLAISGRGARAPRSRPRAPIRRGTSTRAAGQARRARSAGRAVRAPTGSSGARATGGGRTGRRVRERLDEEPVLRLEVVEINPVDTPQASAMSCIRVSARLRSVHHLGGRACISWRRSIFWRSSPAWPPSSVPWPSGLLNGVQRSGRNRPRPTGVQGTLPL